MKKEMHKPVKIPAEERLIWSPRLGMYVDKDTGRPVLSKPVENVGIAAGTDYDIFNYDQE